MVFKIRKLKPVLSIFTGAGLLDRGFEAAGFCVVSAGDILWGRDVRDFAPAESREISDELLLHAL